jgi:uncharacterized delta-60 repeat protein
VKVTGKGFKNGAKAKWFVTGTTDPGGVTVNSTVFVSSTELSANITVADTAVIANFDIQVLNSDGRGGKGTELFAVTAKGQAACPAMQPAPTSDTKCYGALPGRLDSTFGVNGVVSTDPDNSIYRSEGSAMALQNDGKIIVVGYAGNHGNGTETDFLVLRYNVDGSLDTSFGDPNPSNPSLRLGYVVTIFSSYVDGADSVVLQTDGKIVAAGHGPVGMPVARYNTDGTLDPTFGTGGKVIVNFDGSSDRALGMAIQSDGRIIIAGGDNNVLIARLNPDGLLDQTFGNKGKLIVNASAKRNGVSAHANSVAIQRIPAITGEERIVVGGSSNQVWTIMRFKPNGDYDLTFGGSGYMTTSFSVFTSDVKAVVIDSNNRIVAAGLLQYGPNCEGTAFDYGLARYSQDGSLDVSFAGGKQTIDIYGGQDNLKGLAIQPDGKIVIGGTAFSSDMTVKHFALIRFNPNGARDPSFGIVGNGVVTTDFFGLGSLGFGLALQPSDGKILVSGTVYGNPNGATSGEVAGARYWP